MPKAIKEKYPDAMITCMGSYGTGDEYNAFFSILWILCLSRFKMRFLEVQTKYFGTDHYYGADPFNGWTRLRQPLNIWKLFQKRLYDGMRSVDPDAVWVQMGWTFYYMKLWKEDPERLRAMIQAVPENKMIILDYFAEEEEVWRNTKAWHGAPYIWCYLGNFGGNTEMAAPIIKVAKRLAEAESDPAHGKLYGIGSTLEGFGVNRFMFEWLFEYGWDKSVANVDEWLAGYGKIKNQNNDPVAEEAYRRLVHLVYNDQVSGVATGSLMQTRPILTGLKGYQRPNKYDYKELENILTLMLSADQQSLQSEEYQNDLVLVTKQILDNMIISARKSVNDAYVNKDSLELEKQLRLSSESWMIRIACWATQPEFLLGKWIDDAHKFGNDSQARHIMRKTAE